jgi:general secretion pathway protein M
MTLLPQTGKSGPFAVCLLIIVLGLFYWLAFHGFLTGHLDVHSQIVAQQDNELAARLKLAQKPELDRRLKDVKQFEASNKFFLDEDNFDKAAAGISTRFRSIVQSRGDAQRCQVISSQNKQAANDEPFQKVTVQIRLRCDLADLLKIFYDIENSTPLLFLSELNLYQQPTYEGSLVLPTYGNMDATFELSGYIRARTVKPT